MVTSEQFRAALNVQLFRTFRIHMADGRVFEVGDPDCVAVSPQGRTAVIYESEEDYCVLELRRMDRLQTSSDGAESFL